MDGTPEIEARRQEAEREVRRGNFQAAITLYEGLVAEAPDDDRLLVRLDTLRTLLQPMELTHPKAAAGARASSAENDAQEGEAAANAGDLRTAVAAYERACATAPGNALLAERLEELKAMAVARGIPVDAAPVPQAAPATSPAPAAAAPADPPAPAPTATAPADRPAPAPTATAPADPPPPAPAAAAPAAPPLPADPVARLEALLERVQRRRRPRPA